MKTYIPYQLKLLALVPLLLLQACMSVPGGWKNDQIPSDKRSTLHELTNEVLTKIKANDYKHLRSVLSSEMLNDSRQEIEVEHMSNWLNGAKYQTVSEYYIVNKYRDIDTLLTHDKDFNAYDLIYSGKAREMFLVFMAPEKGAEQQLITLEFSKLDYGWKLTTMDIEPYKYNDKTSPELFKLASENYKQDHLIDAYNNALLAVTSISPSKTWYYKNTKGLPEFFSKLVTECNEKYKFPVVLSSVPTSPKIFRVVTKETDEGDFPEIQYQSKINLKDTVAIKREYEQVKKVIGNYMPGINQGKKYLYYTIFNEKPKSTVEVDRIIMQDKPQ